MASKSARMRWSANSKEGRNVYKAYKAISTGLLSRVPLHFLRGFFFPMKPAAGEFHFCRLAPFFFDCMAGTCLCQELIDWLQPHRPEAL